MNLWQIFYNHVMMYKTGYYSQPCEIQQAALLTDFANVCGRGCEQLLNH